MSADLDKAEELLERAVQGQVPNAPPPAWCRTQLDSMREWRGHYDVVAPGGSRGFNQMTMLVRFAMPLHPTA